MIHHDYPVLAVEYGGQLMLDLVVFLLTLWNSLQSGQSSQRKLMNVFLRDGESFLCFITFIMLMDYLLLDNLRYYVLWVCKSCSCLVRFCDTF